MKQRVMNGSKLASVVAITGLLTLACTKGDDPPKSAAADGTPPAAEAGPSTDDQLKDIQNYRLTMDKYDKYLAAQKNIAVKAKALSQAEREAMEAQNQSDGDANQSLEAMTSKIESVPIMKSAIQEAGLSSREFVLLTMSILQSGMAAGVLKMRPNENQDSLIRAMQANPENVKFMQDNEAAITKKQKDLESEMQRLGITSGG